MSMYEHFTNPRVQAEAAARMAKTQAEVVRQATAHARRAARPRWRRGVRLPHVSVFTRRPEGAWTITVRVHVAPRG